MAKKKSRIEVGEVEHSGDLDMTIRQILDVPGVHDVDCVAVDYNAETAVFHVTHDGTLTYRLLEEHGICV